MIIIVRKYKNTMGIPWISVTISDEPLVWTAVLKWYIEFKSNKKSSHSKKK